MRAEGSPIKSSNQLRLKDAQYLTRTIFPSGAATPGPLIQAPVIEHRKTPHLGREPIDHARAFAFSPLTKSACGRVPGKKMRVERERDLDRFSIVLPPPDGIPPNRTDDFTVNVSAGLIASREVSRKNARPRPVCAAPRKQRRLQSFIGRTMTILEGPIVNFR